MNQRTKEMRFLQQSDQNQMGLYASLDRFAASQGLGPKQLVAILCRMMPEDAKDFEWARLPDDFKEVFAALVINAISSYGAHLIARESETGGGA